MRTIHAPKGRSQLRYRRHLRVRQKVAGTGERPRLVVFRSLKHIYAQLVNDDLGVTLLGVGDTSEGVQVEGTGKVARGKAVGKLLAERGKAGGSSNGEGDEGHPSPRPGPPPRAGQRGPGGRPGQSSRWSGRRRASQ